MKSVGKIVKLTENVEKFLNRQEERLRAKLLRQLKYIQEFGLTVKVPSLKKLIGTELWEVRVLGRDNARLMCWESNEVIWVVHGFIKKKQKTDKGDIQEALRMVQKLLMVDI